MIDDKEKTEPTAEEIELAMKQIEGEDLERIQELFPNLDFSAEIGQEPALAQFLSASIKQQAYALTDPQQKSDAPKFDDDFSNFFVINGFPKVDESKIKKFYDLILKTLEKRSYYIDSDKITIPISAETGKTEGVAFVKMSSEEQARIGASTFDGYELTKKIIFTACTMPEFEKIMQTEDDFQQEERADLRDLRTPVFDVKRDQYLYQSGRNVFVNYFSATSAQNKTDENTVAVLENASDKAASFSPMGTYLIIIKADKVVFYGGKNMRTIITLKISKVEEVTMSPCERYVLTYSPMGENVYTIWNFQMAEEIRSFTQTYGEDNITYKWSHDGQYIAKQFMIEKEKEGGALEKKEGIVVYELPEMNRLKDDQDRQKSITIPNIQEWQWCPTKNLLIYVVMIEPKAGDDDPSNSTAIIGFMKVPNRQEIGRSVFKGTQTLRLFMHPGGKYLAAQNTYIYKKQQKTSVELFDLTKEQTVPHQIQQINREVHEFHSVIWEPLHDRFAVHTKSKREIEAGRRDYSVASTRDGIDIYQCVWNTETGFNVKLLGYHPSEKVVDCSWSPAGEMFAICEKDTGMMSKQIWSTFLIVTKEETKAQGKAADNYIKFKGKMMGVNRSKMQVSTTEEVYEFRKTARHEATDAKTVGVWDHFGRCFIIHGERGRGPFDKEKRSIRFYSIYGEPLEQIERVPELGKFCFRPRPESILDVKQTKALEKNYRKLYMTTFKETMTTERRTITDQTRLKKKSIRDEFLNEFYLPLRKQYEDDIEKYEALWPIKDDMLTEQPQEVSHIFAYGEVKKNLTKTITFSTH